MDADFSVLSMNSDCGVRFVDHSNLLSVSERHLIERDVENLERKTARLTRKGLVTAFCLSYTHKHVIVAVNENKSNKICIWQWKPWKLNREMATKLKIYILAVSQEDNYLAALSTGYSKTHFAVQLFSFDSGDLLAELTVAYENKSTAHSLSVSFCAADDGLIFVLETYTNTAKMLRYFAGSLQEFSKITISSPALCHEWLDETTVIFGTQNEKLLFYHEKDKLNEVELRDLGSDLFGEYSDLKPVNLRSGVQIFLCATSMGVIFLWSSPIQWNTCRFFITPQMGSPSQCLSLSLNTTESDFISVTDNAIYHIPLARLVPERVKTQGFEIIDGLHSNTINSISASSQIRRIASSDLQGNVIVRNWDNGHVIALHKFEKNVLNVSLHTLGHHLLVTMDNATNLCAVGYNNFIALWNVAAETPFKQAEFGPLGLKFVLSSTNEVALHDFGLLSCIWTHKIEKVKKCFWSADASHLAVLSASDVIVFSVETGKLLWKWSLKILEALDLCVDNLGVVFILCTDSLVYVIQNGEQKASVYYGYGSARCLTLHHNSLVIGTKHGRVLLTPADLNGDEEKEVSHECHSQKIHIIRVVSGTIFMAANNQLGTFKLEEIGTKLDSDLAFFSKTEFSSALQKASELEARLDLLHIKTEEKIEEQKVTSTSELSQISENNEKKEKALQAKIRELQTQLADVTNDFEVTVTEMKSLYNQESESQERQFQDRLAAHVRKSDQIENWYKERLDSAQRNLSHKQEELRKSFAKTETHWQSTCSRLESDNDALRHKIARLVDQVKHFRSKSGEDMEY